MADTKQPVRWKFISIGEPSVTEGVFPDAFGDKLFWKAVECAELESRLHAEFTITDPVSYGLWMDSPLTAAQCSVLFDLFSCFRVRDKQIRHRLTAFLEVLEKAGKEQGTLSTELFPPGHTDFGIWTTFPHCPHCKWDAPVIRWQKPIPVEEIACSLCGTIYSPAATYSEEEIHYDKEPFKRPPKFPLPEWLQYVFRILAIPFWVCSIILGVIPFTLNSIYDDRFGVRVKKPRTKKSGGNRA